MGTVYLRKNKTDKEPISKQANFCNASNEHGVTKSKEIEKPAEGTAMMTNEHKDENEIGKNG